MPRMFIQGLIMLVLLSGCRHSIVIIGDGDVTSSSGDRDCLLEDFQAEAPACTENQVNGAYQETYYAVARPGYVFGAWGNYCASGEPTDQCQFNFSEQSVQDAGWEEAAPLVAYFREEIETGHNAVFMGNSLFDPVVNEMPDLAAELGYEDHTQERFFSNGSGGSPMGFWENDDYSEYIKDALHSGNISLLGLMHYPGESEGDYLGYKNWIVQAQLKNSGFDVFVAAPWIEDPASYTSQEYRGAWSDMHSEDVHGRIDQLREDFSFLDFYCLPYGQAAVELRKLFEQGKLPELTSLAGSRTNSVFRNFEGHPANILMDLSELIWLRAIYGVDLARLDRDYDYSIDLKALATKILNQHDHRYDAP